MAEMGDAPDGAVTKPPFEMGEGDLDYRKSICQLEMLIHINNISIIIQVA